METTPEKIERNKECPLFPELPEAGEQEALVLIEKFKKNLKIAADDAIGELYSEMVCHIESDAWSNFRLQLLDGFKNYDNRKIQARYDFDEIRSSIYKQFKKELIPDLNQDLVKENVKLKDHIKMLEERLDDRRF